MSKTFTLPDKESKKIYRGDTIIIDAAVSQGGVPVVLTGYSIWFTAKPDIGNNDSASGVIQKTLTSGIVITDNAKGQIRITLSPADTAQINKDTVYQCDIQIKSPSGEVTTTAKGTMTVVLDVTQSTV